MRSNSFPWSSLAILLCLLLGLVSANAQAQEGNASEDDEDSKWVRIYLEAGVWNSQIAGAEYYPATMNDPQNPVGTDLLTYDDDKSTAARYRAGFLLKKNLGEIIGTWYARRDPVEMSMTRPGNFIFGEIQAHGLYYGYRNDGLADGFNGEAATVLRDLRIDYMRTAFKSKRVIGKWFVGYRRVSHKREHYVEYLALTPDLPPVIPPSPSIDEPLDPRSDTASITSDYIGRGVEAGMEFRIPMWKDRLFLEADFLGASMRGKSTTSYTSTTHYYTVDGAFLAPSDYDDAWENVPDDIVQQDYLIGLQSQSLPTSSQIFEASLGIRGRVWSTLELFLGFRSAQYQNFGVDLRPKVTFTATGLAVQDVEEIDRSATYEGFYTGLSYTF